MNLATSLGASATAAALCAGLIVGASSWQPVEPGVTIDIARIASPPAELGALPAPPETPDVQVAFASAEIPAPSLLDQTGGPGPLSFGTAFTLRPAITGEAATGFSRAPAEVAEADDDEVTVTVLARAVTELPPPRPAGLRAEETRGTSFAILDVLPPARPDRGLQLASADPTAPLPVQEPAAAAPATVDTASPRREPGLFRLFGSFAHPGAQGTDRSAAPGLVQTGLASWYGPGFHGRKTASGERFNQHELTAAHRTLPFGTKVRVIDEETGRSIVVRINDRGPFARGRIIDLSRASAQALGVASLRRVKVVSVDE